MIGGGTVLGVIPARGGSRGVPRKNLRPLGGRPLVAWTIEAARGSRYIDRTILSSDDAETVTIARRHGCEAPYLREPALADDQTSAVDVAIDAVARCPGFDWVVLLQPTSPFRTAADIDGALDTAVGAGAPACVSVCLAPKSPYWMYLLDHGRLRPLLADAAPGQRQDLPPVYHLNGAVFAARTDFLTRCRGFLTPETAGFVMPADRSLDIDTEHDFLVADSRLRF